MIDIQRANRQKPRRGLKHQPMQSIGLVEIRGIDRATAQAGLPQRNPRIVSLIVLRALQRNLVIVTL